MKLTTGKRLLIACAALAMSMPASAAVRFIGGGFGYGPAFGPWRYGYAPYSYYGYSAYPIVSHPNSGQIKLDTKQKDAEVYINGAFAGTAHDFKSVWMRQGTYNIEVRSPGHENFDQKIFVLSGKTIHLKPELRVAPAS